MAPPKGKAAVASLAVAVIVGWGVYLGASIKTDKELTEVPVTPVAWIYTDDWLLDQA